MYGHIGDFISLLGKINSVGGGKVMLDEDGDEYLEKGFDFQKFNKYWGPAYSRCDFDPVAMDAVKIFASGRNLPEDIENHMKEITNE